MTALEPDQPVPPVIDRWWLMPADAMTYQEISRRPEVEPFICPGCLGDSFWEDIGGRVHCCECDRIPSLRMLKDFWRAIPAETANLEGTWSAIGWARWFPRRRVLDILFRHLVEAQQKQAAVEVKADGF